MRNLYSPIVCKASGQIPGGRFLVQQIQGSAMIKLTDEQKENLYNDWRDQGSDVSYGDLMDAIEAEVLRLNGIDGRGEAWQGGEEWEQLAWHLCAEENGEDACNDLIWEGGPQPEPWGDRWMKYEPEAKRMIELVRKYATPPQQEQAAPVQDGFVMVPREPTKEMCKAAVIFANGNAVYKNVAAGALEIEEQIYGEAYAAMIAAAPKQEPGA